MTKNQLTTRAKILFNSEYVSEEINKANQIKWVKSVEGFIMRAIRLHGRS